MKFSLLAPAVAIAIAARLADADDISEKVNHLRSVVVADQERNLFLDSITDSVNDAVNDATDAVNDAAGALDGALNNAGDLAGSIADGAAGGVDGGFEAAEACFKDYPKVKNWAEGTEKCFEGVGDDGMTESMGLSTNVGSEVTASTKSGCEAIAKNKVYECVVAAPWGELSSLAASTSAACIPYKAGISQIMAVEEAFPGGVTMETSFNQISEGCDALGVTVKSPNDMSTATSLGAPLGQAFTVISALAMWLVRN